MKEYVCPYCGETYRAKKKREHKNCPAKRKNVFNKVQNTKSISSKKEKTKSRRKISNREKTISKGISKSKSPLIKRNVPKSASKGVLIDSLKNQEKILFEISDSIKEGYEFIVLEANEANSDIAVKLAKKYKDSMILTATEKSKMKYEKKYPLGEYSKIHLSNQRDFYNQTKTINKRKLLVIDDAHRLDETIVDLYTLKIHLSDYVELINSFKHDVKDLPEKDYSAWLDLIDYLSLDNERKERVVESIKQNPDNWICSYNSKYDTLSFYPLNIGNLAYEYWFSKGEIRILISSTILDFELFAKELGLDNYQVKFIHYDLPFNSDRNKIHARKTADMQKNNIKLLIPLIKEILKKHEYQKGLIITDNNAYSRNIKKQINDQRLMPCYECDRVIKKFNENFNSVIVTDSIEDGMEFPYNLCKFQIIVKQHNYLWNQRSKDKEKEYGWYSYKQIVNLIDLLQRPVMSETDYCATYILDEQILNRITNDIVHNKFIPKYILDLIVDLDMVDFGFISGNIKKQFGVYYLFDYDKDRENQEILNYKKYNKKVPNRYLEEFNYFTTKLMEAISELSSNIIDSNINKLALVSVPSSTIKRNESATMKESINVIEKWYGEGKTQSDFKCNKEIINCGDLLKRVKNVTTSHLSKTQSKKRANYFEHMNSIECEKKDILEMEDVAFLILDDISTRGTIMNACEDILVENGVKRENIYKFALYKTQRSKDDQA